MAKGKGILLTSGNGDLLVQGGKLAVGDTLHQNMRLILVSQKGEIKHEPTLGAAIADMVMDEQTATWLRTICDELAKDVIEVNSINEGTNGITIKAQYR